MVGQHGIAAAEPLRRALQNPYVERFNGAMRDEVLNREEFESLLKARVVIAAWLEHYNAERPAPRTGQDATRSAYAAHCRQGGP